MKAVRTSQLFEAQQQFLQGLILLHEFACREAGISSADHYYLVLFSRYGTMTAGELAQRTGLTTGAITGVMARLKKSKMIRRTFDPADRRKVILEPNRTRLTEHMDRYNEAFNIGFEILFKQFSEPQAKALERYFDKVGSLTDQYLDDTIGK
ncbi:MAG: MarR family transcriptional regulator [Chitinophagaceae bacterium]